VKILRRLLTDHFKMPAETVERFFTDLRAMNFYDNNPETTGTDVRPVFSGRDDVKRLLMERSPTPTAQRSMTGDHFGIVSPIHEQRRLHLSRRVRYAHRKMTEELKKNGVEVRKHVVVEKILTEERGVKSTSSESSRTVARFIAIPCVEREHQEHRAAHRRRGKFQSGIRRRDQSRSD